MSRVCDEFAPSPMSVVGLERVSEERMAVVIREHRRRGVRALVACESAEFLGR